LIVAAEALQTPAGLGGLEFARGHTVYPPRACDGPMTAVERL